MSAPLTLHKIHVPTRGTRGTNSFWTFSHAKWDGEGRFYHSGTPGSKASAPTKAGQPGEPRPLRATTAPGRVFEASPRPHTQRHRPGERGPAPASPGARLVRGRGARALPRASLPTHARGPRRARHGLATAARVPAVRQVAAPTFARSSSGPQTRVRGP